MIAKQLSKTFIFLGVCFVSLAMLGTAEANLHNKKNRKGVVYWHGDSTRNKIALTFDDGPQSIYTPQILDILKKYNIRATFFLIGKNVEVLPELAKRIRDEGHIIGNHTYDHPDLRLQNQRQIKQQIRKTEKAIIDATGIKPYLFRPPYGVDNNVVLQEAENSGYTIIKWSVSGLNGRQDSHSRKIAHRVVGNVRNGSIILLHDGNRLSNNTDRSQIVKALPIIIETLQGKGYQFVTINELLLEKEA
ncbi:MAG: polysaccharide deacetylase family protein [Candidatus Omnitrophota bacterium]|jgi:peptidoglycan/xylan/chitin deacetylase (PgdA/CDA1 family)|nr:MAG: polysaccharide deacetylase family protein [Candidatus Omnitrophota bacterium]